MIFYMYGHVYRNKIRKITRKIDEGKERDSFYFNWLPKNL